LGCRGFVREHLVPRVQRARGFRDGAPHVQGADGHRSLLSKT
jgi:hypothetical protein